MGYNKRIIQNVSGLTYPVQQISYGHLFWGHPLKSLDIKELHHVYTGGVHITVITNAYSKPTNVCAGAQKLKLPVLLLVA